MNAVLRWLVDLSARLLPGRYRERFGADLTDTVAALADEASTRGRVAERAYLIRELADTVREAWRQQRDGAMTRRDLASVIGGALRDDVKGSLRRGLHRPAATIGVVVTLAIVVTAVTTTFGLAYAVLWKPLPFPEADRLVFVWEADRTDRTPFRVTSGRFAAWQRESHSFQSLALLAAAGHSVDGAEGSVPVRGLRVSGSFFDTLGMQPLLGRTFGPGDEVPGEHRVLIVSQRMWQARFGGRPDIVGLQIRLSGEPYTVVGVMPDVVSPGWPSNPAQVSIEADRREFWQPIVRTPEFDANLRSHVFGVVGRLRPGVPRTQADAELQNLSADGEAEPHGGITTPFRDQFVRDARTPLLVLLAAALAVLLVACANLAALQVSLVERRRTELAVRLALGAGRVRLAGLLGMDALMPALAGLALGIWWSGTALASIPRQLPGSMPFVTTPALDSVIVAVACVVAGGAAIALSIWPVARLRFVSPAPRGAAQAGRSSVYRWLVAGQVAVGVALALPAALLVQSLSSLRARDPGFVVENAVIADVAVPAALAEDLLRTTAFERGISGALAALPGTIGVAFGYDNPLEANWTQVISLQGENVPTSDADVQVQLRIVSPSYFDAMGVEVIDGRRFEDREDGAAPGAVVVNEAFAAAHGGGVLGLRARTSAAAYAWGRAVPAEYTIVGVVENERFRGLEEPSAPAFYLSTRQFPLTSAVVMVRGIDAGPARLAAIREAIRHAEPDATVGRIVPLDTVLAEQMATRRVTADVVGGFALAAMGLAALGLYGLMAVTVAAGRREMGVRLALGASPSEVARGVMAGSLRHAALGVAVGGVLAIAVARLVRHLLVDVSAWDLRTLATIAAVMLMAAVAAAALPALRAARIDPASALRTDL